MRVVRECSRKIFGDTSKPPVVPGWNTHAKELYVLAALPSSGKITGPRDQVPSPRVCVARGRDSSMH